MIRAFALALAQLTDPRVLRLLGKSVLVTLGVFVVLGAAGWWLLDAALASAWFDAASGHVSDGLRGAFALAGVVVAGWLLWRVIALAVLQLFADGMVEAVEARYYPAAFAAARPLGTKAELEQAIRSGVRALGWNLVVLPFAVVLLVTGIGTALLFWAVNAVLLGRELTDMAWSRHRLVAGAAPPVSAAERLILGGMIAALMFMPFVNLLAPFLGAAAATHLIHRKRERVHATA